VTPEAPASAEARPADRASELRELALLFVRLGVTAFGGPAAHIAMMEDEVVRRRKWLTQQKFLDLIGMTNLIPGPNSTEMAIHIGHERAGWRGLLVAGTAFILPAALITGGFAWAYVRFGSLPQAGAVLYGVKPVIIAIVVQAIWGLVPKAVKNRTLGALLGLSLVAAAAGANELLVLAVSGLVASVVRRCGPRPTAAMLMLGSGALGSTSATASAAAAAATATTAATPFSLSGLFFVFAKIGAVLFGSGYVLLAFLRTDLVDHRHWLTEAQLLDAIAVGQVTPGPVFTTATFVGYLLGRTSGALLATAGIFLPAFIFVALSGLLLPRMRRSPAVGAFLDGVNVASLALMAVVTVQLCRAALIDVTTVVLAGISALLLVRFKVNSTWLVVGGAAVGVAARWLW
jgi:chromate transporter